MFEFGVLVGAWLIAVLGLFFPDFNAVAFTIGMTIGVVVMRLILKIFGLGVNND